MNPATTNAQNLIHENKELRRKLEEAEDLVHAIQNERVDGFVVDRRGNDRVLMLETPDRPYRILVEKMQQGAVATARDGAVLYCNKRFAEMLRRPVEDVVGKSVFGFLATPSQNAYAQ
ncbi:MAG TPA: PAS domain-containing protein, partial [Candidatus Saccharimonadales bacterium]|nr:PAS domain-containing protein [Candidatus Saccharimonadales bacterium]